MSAKRIFTILALVLCAASTSFANAQDPAIIIRSGVSTGTIHLTPGNLTTTIVFPTDPRCFQTSLPIPGTTTPTYPSMTCAVVNQSGFALSSLTFTFSSIQVPLSLANSSFGSWQSTIGSNLITAVFTFATPIPPLGLGNYGNGPFPEFLMDFVNFDPTAPNLSFTATPVPEPATLGLFALGMGGAGAWLRRRRAARLA